jgi:lysophospholipase L1-like esterase
MKLNASVAQVILFLGFFSLTYAAYAQGAATGFALHDGDRLTFYGDSITEQREYTEDIEEYLLTRYPTWKVSFHNAGVGGDKVSGGWAGPINLRLDRDVFAWRPDVITIMLGMNDFYYRPDQTGIFSTYTEGYEHLVDAMQKNNPKVRLTLIQPSPYDDVTRGPTIAGGLNAVLLKYSAFVAQLARDRGVQLADFNSPLTAMLKEVNDESPALAQQVIPDRVHPQQGGHWVMATSLLKSWNAPSLVTSVVIDAGVKPSATGSNTDVIHLTRAKGKITSKIGWTQADKALPLPFPAPEIDPVLALVLKHSDVVVALDQETLRVKTLDPGEYDLLIDDRQVGRFTAGQLSTGINLATMETPMLDQARLVAFDTEKVNNLESARFNLINSSATAEQSPTAQALATAYDHAVDRQRADAQPRICHYELVLAQDHLNRSH